MKAGEVVAAGAGAVEVTGEEGDAVVDCTGGTSGAGEVGSGAGEVGSGAGLEGGTITEVVVG